MVGCVDGQGVVQMDAEGGCWGKSQTLLNQCLYHFDSLFFSSPLPLAVFLILTIIIQCSLNHQICKYLIYLLKR